MAELTPDPDLDDDDDLADDAFEDDDSPTTEVKTVTIAVNTDLLDDDSPRDSEEKKDEGSGKDDSTIKEGLTLEEGLDSQEQDATIAEEDISTGEDKGLETLAIPIPAPLPLPPGFEQRRSTVKEENFRLSGLLNLQQADLDNFDFDDPSGDFGLSRKSRKSRFSKAAAARRSTKRGIPDTGKPTAGVPEDESEILYRQEQKIKEYSNLVNMIPKDVTLLYGPYTVYGVTDFRMERLQGIQKLLEKVGAIVTLVPNTDYVNRLRMWYQENVIFSCRITDLHHGGDGEMDPICIQAAKALDSASRKVLSAITSRCKRNKAGIVGRLCPCANYDPELCAPFLPYRKHVELLVEEEGEGLEGEGRTLWDFEEVPEVQEQQQEDKREGYVYIDPTSGEKSIKYITQA